MEASETALLTRLGNRLRLLRLNVGISQEELAARAKLHRTYVGGIERGERNVAVVNLVRLAKALGVSASEFLDGVDSEDQE